MNTTLETPKSKELDALAVQAKTDEQAFEILLKRVEPLCRKVAFRFKRLEIDEVMQWARVEVWNAVKAFEPGGMGFFGFCGMTVTNHVISRSRRVYGAKNLINITAARYDAPMEGKDGEGDERWTALPDSKTDVEDSLIRQETMQNIQKIIEEANFTQFERDCMRLFYFEERSHKEIAQRLNLNQKKAVDNALTRVRRKLSKNEQLLEEFITLNSLSETHEILPVIYQKVSDSREMNGMSETPHVKLACTQENYSRLKAQGKKNAEIARKFEITDATLYYYLDKWGLREKKKSNHPKVIEVNLKAANLNPAIYVLEKELAKTRQLADQYQHEAQSIESAIKHLKGIPSDTTEGIENQG